MNSAGLFWGRGVPYLPGLKRRGGAVSGRSGSKDGITLSEGTSASENLHHLRLANANVAANTRRTKGGETRES